MRLALLALAASIAIASAAPAVAEPAAMTAYSEEAAGRWWAAHPDAASWVAGRAELRATLDAAQAKVGAERAAANAHFLGWAAHLRWLSLFPDDPAAHPYFSKAEARAAFAAVGQNERLRLLFLGALTAHDDAPKAAEILCRVAEKNGEKLSEYQALAVALAVVFDQPFPKAWPHPFVEANGPATSAADLDPARRFAFYAKGNEEGKFLLDTRRLSVRELTFLVDTPLEFKELFYAQQVNLKTPDRLAQLYTQIPYDVGRMDKGVYLWPHGAYRLIDIGKKGGICVDQAFFVEQTGKSQGVPTVLLLGQGSSGQHGRVGYLKGPNQWEFRAGDYRGSDFPVGECFDPQSWRRITDDLLMFQMKYDARAAGKARLILGWALMNEGAPEYRALLAAARAHMPQGIDIWEAEAAALAASDAAIPERAAFWKAWLANFRDVRDLKSKAQVQLLRLAEQAGDDAAAKRLRDEIVRENKSGRFDLAVAIQAEPMLEALDAGRFDEAEAKLKSAMAAFRSKAGGHVFYNLLQPYVRGCLAAGERDRARRALAYLGKGFEVVRHSILYNDIEALKAEVGG